MSEASQIRRQDLSLIVSSGALRAVSARHAENRRRMTVNALTSLALAAVAAGSALLSRLDTGASSEQWLVLVTAPSSLILLWMLARLGESLLREMALRRDRRYLESGLQRMPGPGQPS